MDPVIPQSVVWFVVDPHAYVPAGHDPSEHAGYCTPESTSESCTVNDAAPAPCTIPPFRYEFRSTRPDARTSRVRQFTTLESITVFATVIVHAPVYVAIELAGAFGPVFDGPGKQPPALSGPSGTFGVDTAHDPAGSVGVGVGVGVGDGVGVAVTLELGVTVTVAVAVTVAVDVAVTVDGGGFGTLHVTVTFCVDPPSTTAGAAVHEAVDGARA